ncbi:MAG: single-stranded DNA-binding protein [Erysipelotrichaceae bacterium]|nr:single-stranded DNA-binding protein [Erysipelotrichaceae bacterium]
MNEFKFFGTALETPVLLESENGNKYCNVFLGVEKNFKTQDGEDIDRFRITCFRSTAEDVCEKLTKGDKVIIKGRIQENRFSKEKGEPTYRAELVGERFEFI